ncbi:hypothetical protein SAMN04488556_4086 [Halostagnicola kamekurae]|uniref:Uncharacterized protein n=1 Tax=Halostagnicola kamekurae TaxID=619731 RepID=A0A1I6UTN5_9EURY|nr:hypothetical protein SAMN04488556_4086 [Halostagnicola kamekurae]
MTRLEVNEYDDTGARLSQVVFCNDDCLLSFY